jgi:FMN phosphatase YigB (HAD superfamily)
MKPLILLDLDRTLFNTARYVEDLPSLISGYTQKTVAEITDYIPTMLTGERDKLHRADYDDFVDFLGISFNEFDEAIREEAVFDHYIYDDARHLIDWLKENNREFQILTFGDPKVQEIKLKISPFLNGIGYTIIESLKNQYIESQLAGRYGCLIDDKPDQALPTGWTEIHIDRKAPDPAKPVKVAENIWKITTLADAPQIIKSLYIANK